MKKTTTKKIQPPSKSNQITVALSEELKEIWNRLHKRTQVPKRTLIINAMIDYAEKNRNLWDTTPLS